MFFFEMGIKCKAQKSAEAVENDVQEAGDAAGHDQLNHFIENTESKDGKKGDDCFSGSLDAVAGEDLEEQNGEQGENRDVEEILEYGFQVHENGERGRGSVHGDEGAAEDQEGVHD